MTILAKKISAITAFILMIAHGALAMNIQGDEVRVSTDSSNVELRLADPDRLAEYRSDPDLTYEERAKPSLSFLEMIASVLSRFLDDIFGGETSGSVVRFVMLLLLMGAILLVLNQILKGNIRHAFYGKSASEPVRFQRDPAVESEENLDRLIEQAANSENYREAVRLTYQKALRDLSRAGLIEWSAGKTNYEYIQEVNPHPAATALRKITRIYEYTEYGDFGIDSRGFSGVRNLYDTLKGSVYRTGGDVKNGDGDEQKR